VPRFVVLIHDYPALHWDLMLEKEAALRTWRLDRPPGEAGSIAAEPLADHRLAYLDYEGPVSGNRGTVRRFDRGDYGLIRETAARQEVKLEGTVLRGRAVIERRESSDCWTFTFEPV
jgi:hypothetical protein